MTIEGKKLDEYQEKAINDQHKSILLVAPAGSGKTLTILAKIKLLVEKGINERNILCISFTNKSVNDVKARLDKIGINCNVMTFHRLALNILNNNKYSLANDNLLPYIIDEYFLSYIRYNKKKLLDFKRNMYISSTKKIYNSKEYIQLKKTILTFIKLAKANMIKLKDIYRFYKNEKFENKIILKYIIDIYTIYNNELKSQNKLDLDDLIYQAAKQVNTTNINYKYIIIDEFQDTSYLRIELVKNIINKCNAKLFCVGDDYQSIYRFSGCNLDIFLNFKNIFKDTSIHFLKNTYRNSKELIYATNHFIMKNKKQIIKTIDSTKSINKPIKIIFNKTANECIDYINDADLLIIGRNNSDIAHLNHSNKLTIHTSKGLEGNNVLLVNSDDIPSKIKNEDILKYVTLEKDYLMYEEERRLFYVALTRTKNIIYIQVNKKISPFVKELIKNYKNYIEIIK